MKTLRTSIVVMLVLVFMAWLGTKKAGLAEASAPSFETVENRYFVESKQSEINSLFTQYIDSKTNTLSVKFEKASEEKDTGPETRAALVAQMKSIAKKIPSDKVPPYAKQLISTH